MWRKGGKISLSLVLLLACVSHVTAVVVSGGRNIQYTEQQPAVAVFAAGTTVTTSGSETIGTITFQLQGSSTFVEDDVVLTALAADGLPASVTASYISSTSQSISSYQAGSTLVLSGVTAATAAACIEAVRFGFNPTNMNPSRARVSRLLNVILFPGSSTAVSPLTGDGTMTIIIDITFINDSPILTLGVSALTYTEDQVPAQLVIAPALTLTEPDTDPIDSFTVAISPVFDPRQQDVINIAGALPSWVNTSTFDIPTAMLSVSARTDVDAMDSDVQALLRRVYFSNLDQNMTDGQRTIAFSVTDRPKTFGVSVNLAPKTTVSTTTITLTHVNDNPVIAVSVADATHTYYEAVEARGESIFQSISQSMTLTDVDSYWFKSASIKLTTDGSGGTVYSSGFDQLRINPASATSATAKTFDPTTGTLSLLPTATLIPLPLLLQELQAIQFFTVSQDPPLGHREIYVSVVDQENGVSNLLRIDVLVIPVDDPPDLTYKATSTLFARGANTVVLQPNFDIADRDNTTQVLTAYIQIDPSACYGTVKLSASVSVPLISTTYRGTPTCDMRLASQGSARPITDFVSIIRSISLTIPAGLSDRGNVYKYNVSFTIWDGVANSTVAYSPYWDLDNFPPPNASPQVLAVTSSNTTGDYVTVTGTWFGPVDQNLVNYVQLGSGFCTDYSVIQENTKLRCEAPEGAGALLSARTSVNGRIGLLNGTGLFSYNRPSITGITPPDTATGFTLIQGYNFGPVGPEFIRVPRGSVTIGGVSCLFANTTVSGGVISCVMGEGSGKGRDVNIIVAGQTTGTTGSGVFRYASPVITSVSTASWFGSTITVSGSNFGKVASAVNVDVLYNGAANRTCTSITVNETYLYCTMPPAPTSGPGAINTDADFADPVKNAQQIVVTVSAQSSAPAAVLYERPVVTGYAGLDSGMPNYRGGVLILTGRNLGNTGTTFYKFVQTVPGGTSYEFGQNVAPYPRNDYGQVTNFPPNCRGQPMVSAGAPQTVCVIVPAYDFASLSNTGLSMTMTFRLRYVDVANNVDFTMTTAPSDAISSFQYEGPVITAPVTGSQFGIVDTTDYITITGRHFDEDFKDYTQSAFADLSSDAQAAIVVSIGGVAIASPQLLVATHRQLVLRSSTATATVPKSDTNVTLALRMYAQDAVGGASNFSFLGPSVTSITAPPPTSGGQIEIRGLRFGPLGAANTGSFDPGFTGAGVTICTTGDCSGTALVCANPQVSATNTKILCTVPENAALGTKITVKVGLMDSGMTGNALFFSAAPTVTSTTSGGSPMPLVGGTLTVTGTNFGAATTGYVDSVLIAALPSTVTCSNPQVTTPHTALTCTLTALSGYGQNNYVNVSASHNSLRVSAGSNTAHSYAIPRIDAVTKPFTNGSLFITITGANFYNSVPLIGVTVSKTGAVGTYEIVATSVSTTVTDSSIVVPFPRVGSGTLKFKVRLGALNDAKTQESLQFDTTYASPSITAVNSPSFTRCFEASSAPLTDSAGTNLLRIEGTSFGDSDLIGTGLTQVTIEGLGDVLPTCDFSAAGASSTTHTVLVCRLKCDTSVPAPASLAARDIVVQVDGLLSTDSPNVAPNNGVGILTLEGPVITAVVTQSTPGVDTDRGDGTIFRGVSMHGGSTSPVTISGRNFGKNLDLSDLISVDICFDHVCVQDASFTQVNSFNRVASVVNTPYDKILAEVPSAPADSNYTVRVSLGNTGTVIGQGASPVAYLPPQILVNSRGYSLQTSGQEYRPPTNGVGGTAGLFPPPGINVGFGPAGTNVFQLLWNIVGSSFLDLVALGVQNTSPYYNVDPQVVTDATYGTVFSMLAPVGAGIISWAPQFNCSDPSFGGLTYCPTSQQFTTQAVKLRYAAPIVTYATTVSAIGGTITISGLNFGPASTPVAVHFMTLASTADPTVGLSTLQNNLANGNPPTPAFSAVSASVTVPHTEIQAVIPTLPPGASGPWYLVVNASAVYTESLNVVGSAPNVWRYAPPTIASVSTGLATNATVTPPAIGPLASATPGVWLQINGTGFGQAYPNQASVQVYVGEPNAGVTDLEPLKFATCSSVVVVTNDTSLWCLLGQGTGANYMVKVVVAGESQAVANAFSYAPPHIASANSMSFLGTRADYPSSGKLILRGENFGPDPVFNAPVLPTSSSANAGISVLVGSAPAVTTAVYTCSAVTVQRAHYEIACNASSMINEPVITNVPLFLTVGGQATTASPSTLYTFQGPNITAVSNSSIFGSRVTVTGFNLAVVSADVNRIALNGGGILLADATPNVTVVGSNLTFMIPLDRQRGLAGDGTDNLISFYVGEQYVQGLVDFTGPRITSTSLPDSKGDTLTIYGRNFGPVGSTYILLPLTVDGRECMNPTVSVEDAQIQCSILSGSGAGKTVQLSMYTFSDDLTAPPLIFNDSNTGFHIMRYAPPAVSQILPASAKPGSSVRIVGTSLGGNPNLLTVTFGGLACTDAGYTVLDLTATDPLARFDFHRSVTCTTPDNGGRLNVVVTMDGQASTPFSYAFALPEIHNISVPSQGVLGGWVIINGDNFGPATVGTGQAGQINNVTFGSVVCVSPRVLVAQTVINCTIPEAKVTAFGGAFQTTDLDNDGRMDVVVCVSNLCSATGNGDFAFPGPNVTSLDLPRGTFIVSRDALFLVGSSFGTAEGAVVATFTPTAGGAPFVTTGATSINGKANGGTSMTIAVPTGLGQVTLSITISGRVVSFASGIVPTFPYGPPVIDSSGHTPPSSTLGGTTIIRGNGFGLIGPGAITAGTVFLKSSRPGVPDLNCTNANVTLTDVEITCTVGVGSGAGYTPILTLNGLQSTGGVQSWNHAYPIVQSVNVTNVGVNSYILVTGINFGPIETTTVEGFMFQPVDPALAATFTDCPGLPCLQSYMTRTHTQFVCVAPKTSGYNIPIYVRTNGLASQKRANFTALVNYALPVITSVTTSDTVGTAITMVGDNFSHDTRCIANAGVADRPCQPGTIRLTVPHTTIECVAPGGAGANRSASVNMTGGANYTLPNIFRYNSPTISSVNIVRTLGGVLTINGTNFGSGFSDFNPPVIPSVLMVDRFGNDTSGLCVSPRVSVNHTSIQCDLQMGAGFNYSLTVTIQGQNSGSTGSGIYRYAPPVVYSSSPLMEGPLNGNLTQATTIVTVTGINLGPYPSYQEAMDKVSITVGSFPVTDRASLSLYKPSTANDTVELSFRVPPGQGSNLPIIVTVDGQKSQAAPGAVFTYVLGVLTSATSVPTSGGSTTIMGSYLGPRGTPVTSVTVGGRVCTAPRFTDDNTVACNVAAGAGKNLDVIVNVNGSIFAGRGLFNYIPPSITAVTYSQSYPNCVGGTATGACAAGITGQQITVTGRNFADFAVYGTQTFVRVCFPPEESGGNGNWTSPLVAGGGLRSGDVPYQLVANVPSGWGQNLPIVVDVAGQASTSCSEASATYAVSQRYSYPAPVVLKTENLPPTEGGMLTVVGNHFGPVGSSTFNGVVTDFEGRKITCLGGTVITDNIRMVCRINAGIGGSLDLAVTRGLASDVATGVMSFAAPTLFYIGPAGSIANNADGTYIRFALGAGQMVNLTGANFGNRLDLLQVFVVGSDGQSIAQVDPVADSLNYTIVHKQLSFNLPAAAGLFRTFRVITPVGAAIPSQNSQQSRDDGTLYPYFDYNAPVIASVTSAPTQGGVVTITGTGFGAMGAQVVVTVQRADNSTFACANARVTAADTEVQCTMPRGSGVGMSVFLNAVDQANAVGASYKYLIPVIEAISPSTAGPGETVTITGKNFGNSRSDISITLGAAACQSIAVLVDDLSLSCVVQSSKGINVTVRAAVKGNPSVNESVPRFTYAVNGCTNPRAVNYDPLSTSDDGSCRVVGCKDLTAFNYDPQANIGDDSVLCLQKPVAVTMRVRLSFATYSANSSYYDNAFRNDVAKAINISTSRINITRVYAGSTVFEYTILDQLGFRSSDAAAALEQLILTDSFAFSDPNMALLDVHLSATPAFTPADPTIKTKAAEKRFSRASIIGLVVGGVVIIVWAATFRLWFRWCCGRKRPLPAGKVAPGGGSGSDGSDSFFGPPPDAKAGKYAPTANARQQV